MPVSQDLSALIAKLQAWKEHDFHADRQLSDEVLIADGWKSEPDARWQGGVRWYLSGNPEYSCGEDHRPHVIHDLDAALALVPKNHNYCLMVVDGETTATVWPSGASRGHVGRSSLQHAAILIAALKAKQAAQAKEAA